MSTSPNAVSAFMLSLSEFACLVSEQHYCFLLQSLNNLEHQIEQHRAERHLTDFTLQTFNNRPHNGVQMPCLLHPLAELPPFSLTSKANPIDNPSTIMNLLRTPLHTTFQHNLSFNQSEDRVSNPRMTNMGSRRNLIYILNDDEVRCEGCWEEGHFIEDCNQEYRYDGEQYVPIVREENLMELTFVVDRDYYQ